MATTQVASGLEGVVVAETRLSDVDGEAGRLTIAGQDVEQLAGQWTFEQLCSLLWREAGIDAELLHDLRARLGQARVDAFALLPALGHALDLEDGMAALRAAVAQLEAIGPTTADDALRLAGAAAVFTTTWARRQRGQAPIAPDPRSGQAADFLRMLHGEAPADARTAALDAYLVSVADHGMNASTFAARVVTSTGSDLVSAIVAGIGALKGPLHGGAPGPVLDMLDGVGTPQRAVAWLEGELLAGRRIMGMGHRIYRVRDPRAAVLERAIERLEEAGVTTGRLRLARAVESAAEEALRQRHPDRPLRANVEFYTAVLLDTLGLPRTLFTPTFAVGRIAGWCGHCVEQVKTGRLIRPASMYVGIAPQR
jgi:citrate synthase